MLADFYITTLSNDMKITVQKNHLGVHILYRSLVPPKKRRHWDTYSYGYIPKRPAFFKKMFFSFFLKQRNKIF